MKNMILALTIVFGFGGISFAGDCATGACTVVQPRRAVSVTKTVVRDTVRLPKRLVTGCVNGTCRNRTVTVVR